MTIGFTYNADERKYYLIEPKQKVEMCLACARHLDSRIKEFCFYCKAPRPLCWTTGNNSLDLFIMKSWNNINKDYWADSYIRWIEYTQLTNVREGTSLYHGCTHMANWLEPPTNELERVVLKKIVDGQNAQLFDFYQVNKYSVRCCARFDW
jgi:hypothetical protein